MKISIGQKVKSKRTIQRAHEFSVPAGKTGTVVEAMPAASRACAIRVEMDEPIPDCAAEYRNSVCYIEDGDCPIEKEFWDDFAVVPEFYQAPVLIALGPTAFGGKVQFHRQFFDPESRNYLSLEVHETDTGRFNCARFVPEGNDGGIMNATLHEAIKWLLENAPNIPEQPIPNDAWC